MGTEEEGSLVGMGLSAIDTFVTFIAIPTGLFLFIALVTWALSAPRKSKAESEGSAITSIK